jgi:uncharacterized protein YjbI with pentapeptide repeats
MAAAVKAFQALRVRIRRLIKGIAEWPTKQTWARRARASNWVLALEIGAVVLTLVGLAFAYQQLQVQAEANRAAASADSWALLNAINTGNSGKIRAMEYLASKQQPFDGIDLSCEAMGGVEENEQGEEVCVRPTYLKSLNLSKTTHGWEVSLVGANLSGAILVSANLSGADLMDADLSGADLMDADLSGASLERASLSDTNLRLANLSGANLTYAELSGAALDGANLSGSDLAYANLSDAILLDANLSGAGLWEINLSDANLLGSNLSDAILGFTDLSGAHLSDADFKDAESTETADFTDAWAWADRPPRNLAVDIDLCVYQDGLERAERPDPCVAPSE